MHPSLSSTTAKEFDMNDLNAQVRRYVDLWNQPDAAQRARLIAEAFADSASYVDPLVRADGATAINATISAVQQQFPDHRFEPFGQPDEHGPYLRFSWQLNGPGDALVARGTDFAVRGEDGRFVSVTGFLDQLGTAA
jgi:SnoaL-like domain